MRDGPFFGYVVWNSRRAAVVVDHDTSAFVWDDQAEAETHMRADEKGDEVCRVKIEFVR